MPRGNSDNARYDYIRCFHKNYIFFIHTRKVSNVKYKYIVYYIAFINKYTLYGINRGQFLAF